ncbi:MAG TPA: ABC transporter permease [Bryobacteraceae bacterium]|jgi:predicted permease|nr:ABC transporter permease [Bryobacteraceae bacterium]
MSTWAQRLFRRNKLEEQLDKEMRFHLDEHANDLMARGYKPEEAQREARISLGGPEQVKEECRDARGTRWLEDLWQDFRYAVRTLRQKPGFAAVVLLTLALGIGATTVMFTLVSGVLLKPFPYADPGRLVRLQEQTDWSTHWGNLWGFTYPNYLDCKREIRSLDMAAFRFNTGTLSQPGDAENINAYGVSSELLPVLGVPVFRGRNFLAEEDRPSGAPVAIISFALWQRHFGGSAGAMGAPLIFDGKSYTVAGVMPAGFRLGTADVDLFTPIGQNAGAFMHNRESHGIGVWARLRPGATLSQAQSELAMLGHGLAEQYPKSNKGRTFIAGPLRANVGDTRDTLWLLLGAVSLVLLIACVNVASLLLARAVSRERELAMRVALGAGRGRLARQCLTESAVLGISGGLIGILLAAMSIRPFVVWWPGGLPRAEEVQLDWQVLLFALAVSLGCGLLFGLAPALRAPSRDLERTLRAGAWTVGGSSRRMHGCFVISEIALAVVLLVCAGMLGRTLLHLASLDPGINVHNVLTARAALSASTLANPARTRAAWQDVLDRARRVPGVRSIAMVDTVPLREGNNQIGYWTTPVEPPPDKQPLTLASSVTPDYLQVMGLTLRQGRFFGDQDRLGSEGVAVIDDVMAHEAFHGEEAVGKHLWIGMGSDPVRVVGVVGHVRYWGAGEEKQTNVRAQLYYPFAQVPDQYVRRWSELMSIGVRTSVDPLSVMETLRRAVRGANNDQVIYEVNTMEQLASDSLARQRFLLLLFGVFAGLALLLASIGIYGVLAYLTSQRVPEIGVRMALGAKTWDVIWLILRGSLGMIFAGVVLGTAAALGAGRALEQLVEGMQPGGVGTFAVMIPVLVAAAMIASFVPARRASRVDPVKALRQE